MPVERVGEHAAEQHAELPPPAQTKPKTPIAFARSPGSVKSFISSASATADDDRAADALDRARDDQLPATSARPQASDAPVNSDDADEEHAPPAVEVAEPAAEQQEAAEGQQVGVDDPGQRRLAEAEVGRIDGSATLTIVTSSTIIRSPMQTTISAIHRFRPVSSTVRH